MPKHFLDGDRIAYDTETTGLNVWRGDMPFAFSFCNENLETKYFEFPVDPFTRKVDTKPQWVRDSLEKIRRLLEDPSIVKVGHNLKFDIRATYNGYGIKTLGRVEDTMTKAHLCNNMEYSYGLKSLCKKLGAMGDEDQTSLKKAVMKCRHRAKKLGWKVAFDIKERAERDPAIKPVSEADYWLPKRLFQVNPEQAEFFEDDFVAMCDTVCEEYATKDAIRTIYLDTFYSQMLDELNVREIYENIERPLYDVIYQMETRGVLVKMDKMKEFMDHSIQTMRDILPKLQKKTWPEFNPGNTNHIRKYLYDHLKLPVEKWTPGGKWGAKKQPAVDKDVMKSLAHRPEIWDIVVWKANYDAYTKFYAKYKNYSVKDKLSKAVDAVAIHCTYKQNGASTGRLACSDPNLQQVTEPKSSHSLYCLQVRPSFGPRPGYVWVCTDYEGMEVVVFAGLSQEPTMLRAIEKKISIHDEMTNTVWGGKNNEEAVKRAVMALGIDGSGHRDIEKLASFWKEMKWTDNLIQKMSDKNRHDYAERWLASHKYDIVNAEAAIGRKNSKGNIKMLTFLKLYGGGAEKAAIVLNCPVSEARRILSLYDNKFQRVNEYSRELITEAKTNGFITTIYGRRLVIDQEFAYTAVNYMIQGSSADMIKNAMVKIDAWHKEEQLDAHLLLQVHDELITEVHESEVTHRYVKKKQRLMCDTEGRLPIPMSAESQIATVHWGDKKSIVW